MKKSGIFKRILPVSLLVFLTSFAFANYGAKPAPQEYFEIKVYRVSQKAQEDMVDAYLKDAYLPALHRAGISKVGVFKPIETDTTSGKLIFVFIPVKTLGMFEKLPEILGKDKVYAEAGKSFLDAPYKDPPFKRYESILLKAFMNMPQFMAPSYDTPPSERIYELRSYESPTEAKASNKRDMFNQGGEISLFKSLNFNAVFYGEVIVGSHMPNLMYMTTFSDMKSHDDHWKAFTEAAEWKKLSGMEEYKGNVSKNTKYLLHPTSYSDF